MDCIDPLFVPTIIEVIIKSILVVGILQCYVITSSLLVVQVMWQ